jgi:aspartate dehydrogenase
MTPRGTCWSSTSLPSPAQVTRIGLIGLGAIGRQVLMGLSPQDGELVGVLVRDNRAGIEALPVHTALAAFLGTAPSVVLEAAGPEALIGCAEAVVGSGATLISVSGSALVDDAFRRRLEVLCRQHHTRVYFPSGALGGLDALAAAAVGGLDEVSLAVTEPGPLHTTLFTGDALPGVQQFPSRLNVAALASLVASVPVQLAFEQRPDQRELVLSARGTFGEFVCSLEPRPNQAQLSHIVALSLLAALRHLSAPLTFS